MGFTEHDLTEWSQQLQAFLMTRLGRRDLARELAQEAVMRLLGAVEAGSVIRHPRGWLFRVARNLAVDEVRRRLPHSVGMEWYSRAVDPSSLDDDDPMVNVGGGEVPRNELLRLIRAALKSLPQRDRTYLHSYYHGGADFEGLAVLEGTSVSTVKGRLYRARKRLREVLVQQVREEKALWS